MIGGKYINWIISDQFKKYRFKIFIFNMYCFIYLILNKFWLKDLIFNRYFNS
jgi:hypothetical protein